MKKLWMILLGMFLLVGCGSSDKSDSQGSTADEYKFEANGVTVVMNEEASATLDKLGEPMNYFEAPSCAFEGIDKTYTYAGFQLVTYPQGDKDHVSSVALKDDSISTPEGVYIGDPVSKLDEVYGTDRTEKDNAYTYTKGKCKLEFIIDGDTITSITYTAITE